MMITLIIIYLFIYLFIELSICSMDGVEIWCNAMLNLILHHSLCIFVLKVHSVVWGEKV